MEQFLSHLWPNFAALAAAADPSALSAGFWILMAAVFGVSVFFVLLHYANCLRRVRAVESLLEGQTEESLAGARRDLLARARDLKAPGVAFLWEEFDESLVATGDQQKLFNTLDAEHFFNARSLAPGLTGSRLLAAAPSFLVAIGVLGTFVGLTIGLANLNLKGDGSSSGEIEALRSGIYVLIQSAAVAFLTSVWGVAFSLLLNLIEKLFERSALSSIRKVQVRIDSLYPRMPAEQSLVLIADHTRESTSALQALDERIGNRLQEAVSGMSEAMQQALSDTLNNIMGPAIDTLVNNANQQSTEVLEKLIREFMSGMNSAGRAQGELMNKAATDVNQAVTAMSSQLEKLFTELGAERERRQEQSQKQEADLSRRLQEIATGAEERQALLERRFTELMEKLGSQLQAQFDAAADRDRSRQDAFTKGLDAAGRRQAELVDQTLAAGSERIEAIVRAVEAQQAESQQLAQQHQALLERLRTVGEAVAESSRHLDSSSNQLGLLSTNLRDAADLMGQRASRVGELLEAAGRQSAGVADALETQLEAVSRLEGALGESARRLEEAAGVATQGFGNLREEQQAWLASVREEFTKLGSALRQEVETLEQQAERWLQDYATEVSRQVDDRMNQWNQQTLSFADQMERAVQSISNIVDDLERV